MSKKKLNLYLLTQSTFDDYVYDSCVVAAKDEEEAVTIHPSGKHESNLSEWPSQEGITVTCVGVANVGVEKGVVCASFRAG